MNVMAWSILSFFSGSLMFSYWIAKLLGIDLRDIRDGNPGAFNLWHAKGAFWGFLGLLLDFIKGFLPALFIIRGGQISGWGIILVGIAPVLGHAFSPFLKYRGGKAIATSFGVWCGIDFFKIIPVWALSMLFIFMLTKLVLKRELSPKNSAMIVLLGMLIVPFSLFLMEIHTTIIILWFLNLFTLLYTHHREIKETIPFFREI